MKSILLALLFIILTVLAACKAKQEIVTSNESTATLVFKNPKHKALKEFQGDTLKYLQTNFLEHQDFYKNKPLSTLLNDLEINVKNYSYGNDYRNIDISPDLSLDFYSRYQKEIKIKDKKNPLVLYVVWKTPLPQEKIVELLRKNKGKWTEEEKNYYGQHIIKEIGMVVTNY